MKLSEAALKGCAQTRQGFGEYFPGAGCACFMGAAALGAGLISPEQVASEKWPTSGVSEALFKAFPDSDSFDARVTDAAIRRWSDQPAGYFLGRAVSGIAVALNDHVGVSREEIAAFLAEYGY